MHKCTNDLWGILDDTSRFPEDMLFGLFGKSWPVVDPKALCKCATRVDFWVEPKEERPWKCRRFTMNLSKYMEDFWQPSQKFFEAAFESSFQEGVRAKYEIKDV